MCVCGFVFGCVCGCLTTAQQEKERVAEQQRWMSERERERILGWKSAEREIWREHTECRQNVVEWKCVGGTKELWRYRVFVCVCEGAHVSVFVCETERVRD